MAPAGRPRAFDEAAVLEAVMLLFWEQGYEATSLTQLREASGLSSASLYGAFGSKEGLFNRAVEHYIAGPGSVTDVMDDDSLSPREAVARLLHGSIEMQTDAGHPKGCLVALTGTQAPSGERDAVAGRRAVDRARIGAAVSRGVAAGELPASTDVDAYATLIHSFLLGVSTQVCDGASAAQLHGAADALLAGWPVAA